MQKLTLKGVKAAARKAFASRKLMAQYPHQADRVCVYVKGDYGCAIGVALNKTTRKAIAEHDEKSGAKLNGSGLASLIEKKIVTVDESDRRELEEVQSLHDAWAGAARDYGAKAGYTKEHRQAFLEAIGA